MLLIPVVAVILAVLLSINSIIPLWGVNSSPEKAAAAAAEAINEVDVEKLAKILPDFFIRENAYQYDLPATVTRKELVRTMKNATRDVIPVNVDILSSEVTGEARLL